MLHKLILSLYHFKANQRSDVGNVRGEFHWRSWLLIMMTMRWSQLISDNTCSQLGNLTINGIMWSLSTIQHRALNGLCVGKFCYGGSRWSHMHFEVKPMKTTWFNHFRVNQGILGMWNESRDYKSSTSHLPVPLSNDVSRGDMEFQCYNTRDWLANLYHCHSFCWHMIETQVHRRIHSICLELRYDSSSTAHCPIPFGTETL